MRASGILMPISSLPSPYGIGTMGAAARSFVDFLVKSGQAYWQILPVCPTSYGDSPYQSFSTFAGNPYFIDLDDLAKQGLLLPEEYASIDWECTPDCINYGVMYEKRYAVLRCAAKRLLAKPGADYRRFVKENDFWLPDYALFMALKDAHNGVCWLEWEEPLRRREPAALAAARQQYADDVAFWHACKATGNPWKWRNPATVPPSTCKVWMWRMWSAATCWPCRERCSLPIAGWYG